MYHVSAQGVDEQMINVHYYLLLVVVIVGWGKDNKHKVPLKNRYVAIILLGFWGLCVILFQIKRCNNRICQNCEKRREPMGSATLRKKERYTIHILLIESPGFLFPGLKALHVICITFKLTIRYLGHMLFVILLQLCAIFAFCWHEPFKSSFIYTKKGLFNNFLSCVLEEAAICKKLDGFLHHVSFFFFLVATKIFGHESMAEVPRYNTILLIHCGITWSAIEHIIQ